HLILSGSSQNCRTQPTSAATPPLFIENDDFPALILPPKMQRLADAAYLAFRHRAMMGGVKFRTHHTLPVTGHHKSGHRSQRFSQRRRRAAMQQAKRLMS